MTMMRRLPFEPVDLRDVGMVERGEQARFTFESSQTFTVGDERLRKDLDRDLAAESRIAGAIDLAHSARTQQRFDLVHAQPTTDQRH